jgi:hypothetical protein
MQTTGQKQTSANQTSTTTLPDWLNQAAQSNYNFAANIPGYTPYTGQLTAPLNPLQTGAANMVSAAAESGNPYLPQIQSLYTNYGSAPASSITAPSVLGNGYNAMTGSIQDYLNPYIQASLTPQLQNIERAGAIMRTGAGGIDSGATSAGAYGDARNGIENAEQMRNQAQLESQVTGQAYDTAFNNAANLRSSDVTNAINAQTTNAGLNEQALGRQLAAGNALQGLDTSQVARILGLANAQNQYGTQAQQTQQAADTAAYNEFLRGVQTPYTQLQALVSSLQGAAGNVNRTTNTSGSSFEKDSAPNNAGWQLLGSILGGGGKSGGGGGGGISFDPSMWNDPTWAASGGGFI